VNKLAAQGHKQERSSASKKLKMQKPVSQVRILPGAQPGQLCHFGGRQVVLPERNSSIGADHLGHSRISITQDKYMAGGRVHTAVADMLDRTINEK
jgi:hypothetical protein